jgi:hypothetical protein
MLTDLKELTMKMIYASAILLSGILSHYMTSCKDKPKERSEEYWFLGKGGQKK